MAKHKIGTVDRQGVFIRVEYPAPHSKPDRPYLSICADIYRSGHDVGGGQALDTVRAVATRGTPAKDWPRKRIFTLLSVWEKWHLNDLRPGCEHQRELGWTKFDEQPSEPCPACGYEYGSAWLYEPLPEVVIAFVRELT